MFEVLEDGRDWVDKFMKGYFIFVSSYCVVKRFIKIDFIVGFFNFIV